MSCIRGKTLVTSHLQVKGFRNKCPKLLGFIFRTCMTRIQFNDLKIQENSRETSEKTRKNSKCRVSTPSLDLPSCKMETKVFTRPDLKDIHPKYTQNTIVFRTENVPKNTSSYPQTTKLQ
jgi:hypothetical protein